MTSLVQTHFFTLIVQQKFIINLAALYWFNSKKQRITLVYLLSEFNPQMAHFILLLDSYVKSIIIEQSWIILNEEFENRCNSIDAIYEAHNNYIKRILFR